MPHPGGVQALPGTGPDSWPDMLPQPRWRAPTRILNPGSWSGPGRRRGRCGGGRPGSARRSCPFGKRRDAWSPTDVARRWMHARRRSWTSRLVRRWGRQTDAKGYKWSLRDLIAPGVGLRPATNGVGPMPAACGCSHGVCWPHLTPCPSSTATAGFPAGPDSKVL